MNITVAKSAGFCFGVDRAVNIVGKLIEDGESVSTLGPIIHNKQVVGELEHKGVTVVNDPTEASPDRTLVIRSHGVGADVYSYLDKNGIPFVDATCPFVTKIHNIVREQSKAGKTILIAGDSEHPEVRGIMGFCETQPVTFKTSEELEKILSESPELMDKSVCLVAQTTFDTKEWKGNLKDGVTNKELVEAWKQTAMFDKCRDCVSFPDCVSTAHCTAAGNCCAKVAIIRGQRSTMLQRYCEYNKSEIRTAGGKGNDS